MPTLAADTLRFAPPVRYAYDKRGHGTALSAARTIFGVSRLLNRSSLNDLVMKPDVAFSESSNRHSNGCFPSPQRKNLLFAPYPLMFSRFFLNWGKTE